MISRLGKVLSLNSLIRSGLILSGCFIAMAVAIRIEVLHNQQKLASLEKLNGEINTEIQAVRLVLDSIIAHKSLALPLITKPGYSGPSRIVHYNFFINWNRYMLFTCKDYAISIHPFYLPVKEGNIMADQTELGIGLHHNYMSGSYKSAFPLSFALVKVMKNKAKLELTFKMPASHVTKMYLHSSLYKRYLDKEIRFAGVFSKQRINGELIIDDECNAKITRIRIPVILLKTTQKYPEGDSLKRWSNLYKE